MKPETLLLATDELPFHPRFRPNQAAADAVVLSLPREPLADLLGGLTREQFYAEFTPLVRRLIRQYGEDPELRQDLEGEIYCRFCELLDSYDRERGIPLRPYLVRMLSASIYTFSRSHWRRQHRETSLEAGETTIDALQCEDPSRQWDHDLVTRDLIHRLPDAIALLPARQRSVVVWRYYEGRAFEEIAERLRVRPATARSLLRHGLNNLRRRIVPEHEAG